MRTWNFFPPCTGIQNSDGASSAAQTAIPSRFLPSMRQKAHASTSAEPASVMASSSAISSSVIAPSAFSAALPASMMLPFGASTVTAMTFSSSRHTLTVASSPISSVRMSPSAVHSASAGASSAAA